MKKSILALTAALVTASLPAQQSLTSMGPLSKTNPDSYWADKYLFTGDADLFMDPNDYGNLSISSFYAEAQGSAVDAGAEQAAGGFAKSFGGFYAAAFFDGNLGRGSNFGFTGNNAFSLLIGAGSAGAFKPFAKRLGGHTLTGLGWGTNINVPMGILKPEVMAAWYFGDAADPEYFDAGLSLDIDFTPGENAESFFNLNYELKLRPGDSAHTHEAFLVFRRLYRLPAGFSAAWGFGTDLRVNKSSGFLAVTADPFAALGFTCDLGTVFGLNGMVFFRYPMVHEDFGARGVMTYTGPEVWPALGGVFRPHELFQIELRCDINTGLDNIRPASFQLQAGFKK